jgi:hypothetical protein
MIGNHVPLVGKWFLDIKIVNEQFKNHLESLGMENQEATKYAQELEEGR